MGSHSDINFAMFALVALWRIELGVGGGRTRLQAGRPALIQASGSSSVKYSGEDIKKKS